MANNLTITKISDGVFDFTDERGNNFGGNNIEYWYDASQVYFKVNGETHTYLVTGISYDDGSSVTTFTSITEFSSALKTAGFTGNFNSGGATPQIEDATDTIKGIAKLYNGSGVQTDGGITPNAVTNQIASASIVGTSVLINDMKIIRQGIDYRFNDFSTYTKTGTSTLTAGLNVNAVSYECINTGKIITKDAYSITLTGTCGTTNTSSFGFGLKDGSNFHSILYRGSTGFVQGLQYGVNTAISTINGGDFAVAPSPEPLYNVGDVVSIRVFFEQSNVCWQSAVNGVWQPIRTAHVNAFKNLGELILMIRTTSNWTNIGVVVETKAEYSEIVYISTTGLDTNSGTKAYPMRTVAEARRKTKGVGRIIALAGDYFDEPINFMLNLNLEANDGDKVRFIYGERITSASFTGSSTKVYEITHAAYSGTPNNVLLYQHDIADPLSAIIQQESIHNGKQFRLPSLQCTYLTGGVSALEASDPTRSYWYQSGGKIYFTIKNGTTLATNPIVFPSTIANISGGIKGVKINMKNINFLYASVNFEYTRPNIIDCSFLMTNYLYVIEFGHVISGRFENVEVGSCRYINGTSGDGFSAHANDGVSGQTFHSSTATFINCWSHSNIDDGLSVHQFCEANIYGGLFEKNGTGLSIGVGGSALIENIITRNNSGSGVEVVITSSDGNPSVITLKNVISENNGANYNRQAISDCILHAYNCVAKGTGGGFASATTAINCVVIP